jgi:hypothetical protein
MNTTSILENVSFLHRVLKPVDENPPNPTVSPAISDYIIAGLLRDISVNLHNREFAATVHSIGKELASTSAHGLAADWEGDGDGVGPVHPKPWWFFLLGMELVTALNHSPSDDGHDDPNVPKNPKIPRWPKFDSTPLMYVAQLFKNLGGFDHLAGPSPEPWFAHTTPAMNDIILAHALRQLASLTSSEKASSAIKTVGEGIVKSASARLFDEYCGTAVKHYIPMPKPKGTAA